MKIALPFLIAAMVFVTICMQIGANKMGSAAFRKEMQQQCILDYIDEPSKLRSCMAIYGKL